MIGYTQRTHVLTRTYSSPDIHASKLYTHIALSRPHPLQLLREGYHGTVLPKPAPKTPAVASDAGGVEESKGPVSSSPTCDPSLWVRGLRWMNVKLMQVGLDKLSSVPLGKKIPVAPNTVFAPVFTLIKHGSDSARVASEPLRAAYLAQPRHASRCWIETEGMLQLGTGAEGTLPLGAPATLSAGFSAQASMLYRMMLPYEIDEHGLCAVPNMLGSHTVHLPVTPKNAIKLTPGSTFSIEGQGRIEGHAGLAAGWGAGTVGAEAKATVGVDVGASYQGDMRMSVMRLQDETVEGVVHPWVRVTCTRLNQFTAHARVALEASLKLSSQGVLPENTLKEVIEKAGAATLLAKVNSYASVSASWNTSLAKNMRDEDVYEFDLSNPQAMDAYIHLWMGMHAHTQKLGAVARAGVDTGVRWVSEDETSRSLNTEAQLMLFGNKMAMFKRDHRTSKTVVIDAKGHRTRLDEEERTEALGCLFFKEASSSCAMLRTEEDTKDPWYSLRVKFQVLDKQTHSEEARFMYKLAYLLGDVKALEKMRTDEPKIALLDQIKDIERGVKKKDDTLSQGYAEISMQALKMWSSLTPEEATYKALKTLAFLEVQFEDNPCINDDMGVRTRSLALVEEYTALRKWRFIGCFTQSTKATLLALRYRALTGREIDTDAKALDTARRFSEHTALLKTVFTYNKDPDKQAVKLSALFARISASYGSDMRMLLGLVAGAVGPDAVWVKEMSLETLTKEGDGSMRFKMVDEGTMPALEAGMEPGLSGLTARRAAA